MATQLFRLLVNHSPLAPGRLSPRLSPRRVAEFSLIQIKAAR
jgi:hypothetical protein